MPNAKSLRDLMKIRDHNHEYLDSINGNLGTALGFKKREGEVVSEEPAVIVFVPQKINPKWIPGSQLIKKRLEGPDGLSCLLDVVEGGKAAKEEEVPPSYSPLAERLRGWDDKVWSGSQLSHWVGNAKKAYSMGTLGAFARSRENDQLGFLTNQHVGIEKDMELFHPLPWGTHIGTTKEVVEYQKSRDWYGMNMSEADTYVRIDCAFVELTSTFKQDDINPHMMGVGPLGPVKEISLDDMSIIGQKVLRVGRTTGLRYGTVAAFCYEWVDEKDISIFTDLLIIGDNDVPFSTHGDSGSLIVTNDGKFNPIGLLWGGWQEKLRTGHAQENWTYGIDLFKVMNTLNIDLVSNL